MNKTKSILGGIALSAAAALTLSGCAGGTGGVGGSDAKSIEIAVFNGWDEGIAASYLWQSILEDKGYDVKLTFADVAPVYQGLARGDFDLVLDTWLPTTHADYMERYGDKVDDLGAWNDDARLTVAVNADAPIDSLDQLAAASDQFGGRIVGIEPGSGLMRITGDDVVPGYGLEGMELVESSTPAMLAELKKATDAGQNIAVTLWRPHWAYNAFPVKDLADPKGLLGDAESIHSVAASSFAKDHPEVHGWISNFTMPTDTLASLENAMFNEYSGDDYAPVIKKWIAENQEWVDSLTS
ncbi:glycine betaine ABC transporter substrate-binding protein [Microbacterium laevaniformans]|uniref:Glycine betaine ABC transporter substrate-binding protein n=1 Tax=Microbacterium laevaniformans TaxID=36807 RepID=A0A4S2D6A4_9MICO|nr:glycine betaine ABC transporter substrate-binding protein [Microbacterium laevaniformans]TGY36153.1 glycine betaine ABC transporter substrate-binding protein [Microbacterium laevaniformans]